MLFFLCFQLLLGFGSSGHRFMFSYYKDWCPVRGFFILVFHWKESTPTNHTCARWVLVVFLLAHVLWLVGSGHHVFYLCTNSLIIKIQTYLTNLLCNVADNFSLSEASLGLDKELKVIAGVCARQHWEDSWRWCLLSLAITIKTKN